MEGSLWRTDSSWYMNHPTLCYRKMALLDIGGYNETDKRLKVIHDYDLIARLLKMISNRV
jgi:hypothetical protein